MTNQQKNRIFVAAAGLILLWQTLKGFSLTSALYPLATAVMTYADGPVRRALLPSLYQALGYRDFMSLEALYSRLHLVWLALLLAALLVMARNRARADRPRLWLLLLLLAGPLVPLMAATAGYSDIMLVLALLAINGLLARRRPWAAGAVLVVATFQHEMVLLLALPLFLANLLLHPEQRRHTASALFAGLGLGLAWSVVTAAAQPDLYAATIARCAALRPDAHPLVTQVWDVYCERQMRAGFGTDFRPLRLVLLPFYFIVYGLFPLAALLLAYGLARLHGRPVRAGLLLASMFTPFALAAIAWDVDRFFILTFVPVWLVLDAWLKQNPPPAPAVPLRAGMAALILFQLAMQVPAVDFYASNRLVPPALESRLLLDPRRWAFPVFTWLGVPPTPQLDPVNCVDPRCSAKGQ